MDESAVFGEGARNAECLIPVHVQRFYLAIFTALYNIRESFPILKFVNIFPILYILGISFPNSLKKKNQCRGKGSFPKSQIKSLMFTNLV